MLDFTSVVCATAAGSVRRGVNPEMSRFLFTILLASCAYAHATEWNLVWSDEFGKDGPPNPENWDFERGFVRNEELQFYQPENAVCKNGILIIEARKEHKPNPNYSANGRGWKNREFIAYTSACLITRKKHEFTYGKFEIRARIDTRKGSWPAFWTVGPSRPWPGGGEIDIMEFYSNKVLANVCHNRGGKENWTTNTRSLKDLGGEAWSKEFHIWTMEWTAEKIDLLLDGKLITHFDTKSAEEPKRGNPFINHPQYMLLNQAIGGRNGGDPSGTEFPVRYEIDWVRVYQAKEK